MAALICDGIGKLCSSCGSICVLPCRIISKVCESVCSVTGKLCSGPFCVYTITAIALNLPSIIISAKSLSKGISDCKGSSWLLVNLILCVINILAAWYISAKSQDLNDPGLQNSTTMFSRIVHVLCYDPFIAIYIILLAFFFCWLGVGIGWKASDEIYNGGGCDDSVSGAMTSSIACGYSFFCIGFMALCCSLCVAGCDGRRFSNNTAQETPIQEQTQPQSQYSSPSPTHTDVENNIPVATPVNVQNEKPDYKGHNTYGAVPAVAVAQPIPSAPPIPTNAESKGATIGGKIGSILTADKTKQAKLQEQGAKAGVAVSGGISAAKNFFGMKKG
mmetsp:Transcript_13008/g.15266  ORF Transcript_13008/g.15266 Transcript_13008/m.15266 type:complete len:332 (-) Transcript_13008:468-1463(-)